MLHILTGRAGSGKTTQVLRRMREAGERRPQLLLVPEQASFETERRFCRENGNQAGRYGEVLSFTRLENRVLSLGGGAAEPVLDAGGRLLVLYAALRSVQANLTVYAMPSQKPAFLTSLLTTLDELKSYCITGEQLTQVGEETEGMDGEKLRDLGLIFGAYEAMTARGALDPRDRLTRLAEKLRRFPFFQGQDVYLDGFTDFTPQQGLVLAELLRQAHSVTLALTYGEGAGEEAVFAPARKTLAWIKGLAAKVGCPVEEEALPAGEWERTPPLRHLEQALFAHPMPPYTGPWDGSIVVHELPSPREEVAWAAGEIRALVRQGRVRYRDIVVTARSMDPYWEQLEGVFAQYDIPLFQADKTDLLQKPLFTLITAALDAVNGGYLYEDMFRYLKTGLAGLSLPECDQLENYVLTWDIWGSRWTGAGGWTRHPGGYHQRFTPQDEETLETLNALRLRVIQPLERLRKNAGGTIGEQVLALYQFLEEIHAPEHLEARSAALLHQGEPELARQYSQLWEIFCRALEQCAALLGEVEAEFADFSRLLRLLLSQYSVGTIPASLDRVTAGDAQRLGGRACKVLFLLGAEDGAIPQVAPGQGLLTDQDRLLLEDYGLTCSPRLEEKISRENTIVYTTCAQPTERLCVTWPFQGAGGGEKRPSFLVERLNRLFPAAAAQGGRRPPWISCVPWRPDCPRSDRLCRTIPSATRCFAAWIGRPTGPGEGCRRTGWRRCTGRRWPCRPLGWISISPVTLPISSATAWGQRTAAQRGSTPRSTEPLSISCWKPCCGRFGPREAWHRSPWRRSRPARPGRWRTMWPGNWGGWSTRPPASAISSAGWNEMSGRWWTMWWRNSRLRISSRCFLSWDLVREKSSLRWRSPREA